MVYHKLILLVDKFIGPIKKAGDSSNSFFKGYDDKAATMTKATTKAAGSVDQLTSELNQLKASKIDLADVLKLSEADAKISVIERKLERLGHKKKERSSSPVADMIPGAAAVAGGAFSISEIFDKTAEIERLGAMFRTSFGEKAMEAFQMVNNVAQKTPFEMNEVAESFIKLKNRGFEPTEAMMMQISDTSSSMGKGFLQVVEAMLDATTGHTARLEELGIAAEVHGNKIKVLFKDGAHEYEKSNAGIQKMIEDYSKLNGVLGSSEGIMATLGGMWSNFQDKASLALAATGTAFRPVIELVLYAGGLLLNALNGTANWIVEHQETLGNFFRGAAVAATVFALGWAAVNAQFLYFSVLTKVATAWQWLLNAAMKANPVFLIGAAIVVVGGLLGMLLAKFQPVADFFDTLWQKIKAIGKAVASFLGIDLDSFDSTPTLALATQNRLGGNTNTLNKDLSVKNLNNTASATAEKSSSPKITTINFGPMSFNIKAIAKGGDMASLKELANEVAGHIAAGLYDVDVQFDA